MCFCILLQANVIGEALLPPGEVRLKNIIKFLQANAENLKDIDALGRIVFAKSSISVEEGSSRLKKIILFYQDCLDASLSTSLPCVTIGNLVVCVNILYKLSFFIYIC